MQHLKKRLSILTVFIRSEISQITFPCKNNVEFPNKRVSFDRKQKIMSTRLVRQNLSNPLIKLFLPKKQVIDFTSSFTHKQIMHVSKTQQLKTHFVEDKLCLYLEPQKDSVTFLKNLKLLYVNLFELSFLQTFHVRTKIDVNKVLKHKDLTNLSGLSSPKGIVLETKLIREKDQEKTFLSSLCRSLNFI